MPSTATIESDGPGDGARATLGRPVAARLTTTQSDRLLELAGERGVSVSTLLREATDHWLAATR